MMPEDLQKVARERIEFTCKVVSIVDGAPRFHRVTLSDGEQFNMGYYANGKLKLFKQSEDKFPTREITV